MNFASIKNILYNSAEIQDIPDRWQESVPFLCCIKDELCDAFLYYRESNDIELKRLIAISMNTGAITVFDGEQLIDTFKITTLRYAKNNISDYDEYFSKKDAYEQKFGIIHDVLDSKAAIDVKLTRECHMLFKDVSGERLYNDLYSVLAKDYIELLCGNIQ